MLSMDSTRLEQTHVVELVKENTREFRDVLRAVMFRDAGTFDVNASGVRVIVDDQHCQQAIAYIQADLFSLFNLQRPTAHFRVPLNTLTECMNILDGFGGTTKMLYDGAGSLKVLLEHDGMVVTANINTLTPQHILDFEFDQANVKARLILKTDMLRQVFKEFDSSSQAVLFIVSKEGFSMQTKGDQGMVKTTIPATSEQVDIIDCETDVSFSYRLTLLKRMTSSLSLAHKVSIRCDSRGILSMQFMIDNADHNQIFIEFFCVPDNDIYDEDNDESLMV